MRRASCSTSSATSASVSGAAGWKRGVRSLLGETKAPSSSSAWKCRFKLSALPNRCAKTTAPERAGARVPARVSRRRRGGAAPAPAFGRGGHRRGGAAPDVRRHHARPAPPDDQLHAGAREVREGAAVDALALPVRDQGHAPARGLGRGGPADADHGRARGGIRAAIRARQKEAKKRAKGAASARKSLGAEGEKPAKRARKGPKPS